MGKIDCGHYVPVPVEVTPTSIVVESGTSLSKVVLVEKPTDTIGFDHVIVKDNSRADIVVIVFPGVSIDIPIAVDVVGRDSEISISGLYVCGSDEDVSFSTNLRHLQSSSKSVQIINGIAGGSSHANFYGRIVIAPEAQKIQAYQTNRNVLLSETAVVNTKPQLEIYADDVKCSHGATIGKLNEDEQFYMRSRGIPEKEAKVLQMLSFLAPVFEHIEDEDQREKVLLRIESAIREIA